MTKNIIPVGRFGAPHGVKGWIRVISFTKPESQIITYAPWNIKQGDKWVEFSFDEHALWSKKLVVLPSNFINRNEAEPLVNIEIGVSRDALPKLEDSFYWCDLIGIEVKTVMGLNLGHIDSIMETGANDVLIIKGKQEHLVPFKRPEVVKSIDIEKGEMLIDWEPME